MLVHYYCYSPVLTFSPVLLGDWEEHATLLCNFFLHLNKTAYLVQNRYLLRNSWYSARVRC